MQMLELPEVSASDLAWISEVDMIEVDRVMIEDLQITLIQMMENAGRALARVVREMSGADRVTVFSGSGGNGGGGMVAARHLANAGVDVVVTTTRPQSEMTPVPAHQFGILERMGVPVMTDIAPTSELVIDAVIGYSLKGAPRGKSAEMIQATTGAATVVSLDTPSGLDVTSGSAPGDVVNADATVTLALPKAGLRDSPHVGTLYLADISVPPSVTAAYGAAAPSFGTAGLLRVGQ